MDTGEMLRERPMTANESQGVMFSDLAHAPRAEKDDEVIDLNQPKALPPKRQPPAPPEEDPRA